MSLFTKIIQGEIPCHKIAEEADYFSFLEIRPLKPGHTLVIPKKETDYFFDLSDAETAGLMKFCKKVAGGIKKARQLPRFSFIRCDQNLSKWLKKKSPSIPAFLSLSLP